MICRLMDSASERITLAPGWTVSTCLNDYYADVYERAGLWLQLKGRYPI